MSIVTSNIYGFGEFVLNAQGRVLKRGAEAVPLTPKAFDVLLLLVQNGGKTLTKDELMKAVWGDSFVEESNLTQTIFMIRKALDEASDRRYIVTVQGQGYRFVVPVREEASEGTEIEAPPASADAGSVSKIELPSPSGPRKWRRAVAGLVAIALVLFAGYALWTIRSVRVADKPTGRTMLAVLPFENFTGDAGQEYFSDGLTEEMISQLGDLDPAHLGVIARTSVMHYKNSREPIPQIGKDLGVEYVVEGSVRRDSERVRITAQLIQVKDQSHVWAREYDRDLGHLLELQTEIAREVASEIEFSLAGRHPTNAAWKAAATVPGASSYEAYDLYLKGRYFWNKRTGDGFHQAADYFQQAIDKDPNYGRAYAGLADTFALMSTWYVGPQNELMPKARNAAMRALAQDESLAEAHASLALIKESYDYDWPGAEKEFRRAIELDPQYPTAHQWYAEFLSWQGRFDEAFAESARAQQLDPLSMIIATDHASILYQSRQFESAIKQCQSVLKLDPSFDRARGSMVGPYLQLGKYDEAIAELRREAARGEDPWAMAWGAVVYNRSGHMEEARRELVKLERLPESRSDRLPTLLMAYVGMGDKERALGLLEKAYVEHSNVVVQMKVEPLYDPLRSDPRFADLLRRVGLER